MGQLGGRREARLEDEIEQRRLVDRLPRLQQPHGFGASPNAPSVEALAIVAHRQNNFVAFLNQPDGDFTDFWLAHRNTVVTILDTVRHGIAQHVLDRGQHLVEHRTVDIDLAADDVEVGPLAQFLGGLADDAIEALGLAGEGQHAHTHQFLLQTAVQARLGKDRRVGIIQALQQVLLDRRHVVHRLGHETGEFLEAGEAVQFQRVEIDFAARRMRHLGLDLGLGLDFDFAQLTAQTNDVFGQFEQRALQAAHLAFDPRPGDRQLAGLVNQAVDQVSPHPQRRPLPGSIAFRLRLGRRRRGRRSGTCGRKLCRGRRNVRFDGKRLLRPFTQTLDGLGQHVATRLNFLDKARRCRTGAHGFLDTSFQ